MCTQKERNMDLISFFNSTINSIQLYHYYIHCIVVEHVDNVSLSNKNSKCVKLCMNIFIYSFLYFLSYQILIKSIDKDGIICELYIITLGDIHE